MMESLYDTRVVPVRDMPEDTIGQMASLYLDNFDGSSSEIFREDLADKDESILLYHDEALIGFTTMKVFDAPWGERRVRVVYSGDTIVAQAHWGQQALAFRWLSRIGEIARAASGLPLFWFLLVKGHRTFKYLSVFGKSFFPHWSEYRADLKALADRLASAKFGRHYDPASGLVRFPESRGHLKREIAEPSAEEMKKISTRFFLERNPDYRRGHELVCLCELESGNMKPLAARLFNKTAHAAGP
ncbi:MAG: hypothetical protein LBQ62_00350 [Candidatus Accumulibacter sp.]|jgi:hypothetical protein|nr:hypothetical protein [Accumulibacter sp.]